VLCFQVFQLDEQQLISRSWLFDPAATLAVVVLADKVNLGMASTTALSATAPRVPGRMPKHLVLSVAAAALGTAKA
jgi:hypothetical protein